jgi:pentatricopeptide repeat protein
MLIAIAYYCYYTYVYKQAGQWERALDMLQSWRRQAKAEQQQQQPLSAETVTASNGEVQAFEAPDAVPYGIAIAACGKAGKWAKALDVLAAMSEDSIKPNVIAFSAAIQVITCLYITQHLLLAGVYYTAVSQHFILNELNKDYVAVSTVWYNMNLCCCHMHQALGAAGEWQRALDVYDSMKEVCFDRTSSYHSLHCWITSNHFPMAAAMQPLCGNGEVLEQLLSCSSAVE